MLLSHQVQQVVQGVPVAISAVLTAVTAAVVAVDVVVAIAAIANFAAMVLVLNCIADADHALVAKSLFDCRYIE
jgi:hypothetical protein